MLFAVNNSNKKVGYICKTKAFIRKVHINHVVFFSRPLDITTRFLMMLSYKTYESGYNDNWNKIYYGPVISESLVFVFLLSKFS